MRLTGNKKADDETLYYAEQIRAKREIELATDDYDIETRKSGRDFLKYYAKIVKEQPDLEKRVTLYKHLTNYIKLNNIMRLDFKDVNESFWIKFKKYLRDDIHHAQYTIFIEFVTLKTIMNRAMREKVITRSPLMFVKEKRPKTHRSYLTWEEVQVLYDTPCSNPAVKNAFLFACYTGIRLGDIEQLQKKDFWPDKIIVPSMQKTDDSVSVDYDKDTMQFIPGFDKLNPDDYVFNLPSRSIIQPTIKGWVYSAKITKSVSFHTSRHTFATGILKYSKDIKAAQSLLGHRSIKTTEIYAHLIDKSKGEAVGKLPRMISTK